MHRTVGVAVILLGSVLALVTVGRLRASLRPSVVDALMAASGALIGVGGLALLDDVSTASWVAAPVALAVVAPLNVRALFAPGGPFRT